MRIVGWVNAEAHEWFCLAAIKRAAFQARLAVRRHDCARCRPASAREYFSRAQIAHDAQPRGVFQSCICYRAFAFRAQKPCRRDETARRKPERMKFFTCARDPNQRLFICEIVKFAFIICVKTGQEFFARSVSFSRTWTFVKISVNHDFVSSTFQFTQPNLKFAIGRNCAGMMVIWDDQKRGKRPRPGAPAREMISCRPGFASPAPRRGSIRPGPRAPLPPKARRGTASIASRWLRFHAGILGSEWTQTSLNCYPLLIRTISSNCPLVTG